MSKTTKNLFLNISYQIFSILVPLITAPYIARVMTPHEIGIYSYSSSFAGYISVFMLLGISNYGSRTIAMNLQKTKLELSKVFWEMYAFQGFSSLLGITAFLIAIPFLDPLYRPAVFAQIFLLLSVALDISWFFMGKGQFKVAVVRGSVTKVLQLIAIFLIVKSPNDLLWYVLIMSAGSLIGNVLLWVVALRQISCCRISFGNIVSHIKPNLVLFLPLLASSVFVYIDKIMLGSLSNTVDLGWYDYAEKIVRIPLTVISAIGAVMMPLISSIVAQKDSTNEGRYMIASMRYVSLFASISFFGILSISPEFVLLYFGESYTECGGLMQMMAAIILFSAFANILRTQYLIPQKKDRAYVLSIASGAVVNVFLNALLIPHMGGMGAALGTVGAELFVFVSHLVATRKALPLGKYVFEWFFALLCGLIAFLIMEAITPLFDNIYWRFGVGFVVGVTVYLILAVLCLLCRKDQMLQDAIERIKSKGNRRKDT